MSVILDFPDDPAAVGNIYVAPNGVTYYYDGVKWIGENSVNTLNDRITAGDKSLIIDTDGNITFPQGTLLGYSDPGGFIIDGAVDKDIAIYTYSGSDLHGWTFGTDGNLTFPNGDLTIGSDTYGAPAIMAAAGKNISMLASGVGDGYEVGSSIGWVDSITEPTKIAAVTANNPLYVGAGDVGIVTGDYFYHGTTNVWNFGTDGILTLPEYGTIRSQPSSSVSIESDLYTDIAWVNPAIFDLDSPSFDNLNAGDTIGNAAGVDQEGVYLSVIVANTDGATSATFGTWGVNTDGNLFTERFTQGLGSGGTTELPPGDIIDLEGNSLVYVPTTDTAPSHDHNGLLWFNTEDGRAYIRYNHQWVDANPPVVAPVSAYLDGLVIEGQTISSTDYVESAVKIGGDLVPDEDLTYNLGSPTKQWKHLYVDSHTIYMGGKALSLTNQGLEVDGRTAIYEIDGGVASTWLTV